MELSAQVENHEKRLKKVELFIASDVEKAKHVQGTFERMEKSLEKGLEAFALASKELLEAVEKRFASKTDLQLLQKEFETKIELQASEGKWKTRFIGAASSVLTAIVLIILGFLIPNQ